MPEVRNACERHKSSHRTRRLPDRLLPLVVALSRFIQKWVFVRHLRYSDDDPIEWVAVGMAAMALSSWLRRSHRTARSSSARAPRRHAPTLLGMALVVAAFACNAAFGVGMRHVAAQQPFPPAIAPSPTAKAPIAPSPTVSRAMIAVTSQSPQAGRPINVSATGFLASDATQRPAKLSTITLTDSHEKSFHFLQGFVLCRDGSAGYGSACDGMPVTLSLPSDIAVGLVALTVSVDGVNLASTTFTVESATPPPTQLPAPTATRVFPTATAAIFPTAIPTPSAAAAPTSTPIPQDTATGAAQPTVAPPASATPNATATVTPAASPQQLDERRMEVTYPVQFKVGQSRTIQFTLRALHDSDGTVTVVVNTAEPQATKVKAIAAIPQSVFDSYDVDATPTLGADSANGLHIFPPVSDPHRLIFNRSTDPWEWTLSPDKKGEYIASFTLKLHFTKKPNVAGEEKPDAPYLLPSGVPIHVVPGSRLTDAQGKPIGIIGMVGSGGIGTMLLRFGKSEAPALWKRWRDRRHPKPVPKRGKSKQIKQ
jgi:hypothetical protein